MSDGPATGVGGEAAVWHDVECGAYAADLALWRELAHEAAGPVLELGCGTGRVALDLAAAGHEVTGVDTDRELIAALSERAAERGVDVEAVVADARELDLGREFALVCAPMQFVHLLGPSGRVAMLRRVRAHLGPGGRLAAAMLAGYTAPVMDAGPPPLPDVREIDGWIFSSQPLDARAVEGRIAVRRLRQRVSPAGDLREYVDVIELDELAPQALEGEALALGFAPAERIEIPPTPDHVGSTVVVLEAA